MTRRQSILLILLIALLAMATMHSYRQSQRAHTNATACENDLAMCTTLAERLGQLDENSTFAASHTQRNVQLRRLVEHSAKQANIPEDSIKRMSPESAARLGDTPYKEYPTRIHMRNVTRKQLVTMMHDLLSTEEGLRANTIRLSSPNPADTSDQWNVEILLTDLRYDPPQPKQR